MNDPWVFLLGTLAAYFVTWVVVESAIAAPFVDPLRRAFERRWILRRAEPGSDEAAAFESTENWNSKLAYLLSCIPCLGFWVSGATTVLLSVAYGADYLLISWLAMAGIIGLIGRFDRN
jgi:hypothetical protein